MHGNILCHLVLLAGSVVNLCLSCVFFFDVGSVLLSFCHLLVTLFPLGDGGVLVAVTVCVVLNSAEYYLLPVVSVGYLLA
jgi:hypothetical protein